MAIALPASNVPKKHQRQDRHHDSEFDRGNSPRRSDETPTKARRPRHDQ
jgi:hypothetical protein